MLYDFILYLLKETWQVMDMGLVAHLASLKSSVPFVHFFDGTRTSGVIECVKPIPYSTMKPLARETYEHLTPRDTFIEQYIYMYYY